MAERKHKKSRIETAETALGYGELFEIANASGDATEQLIMALSAWAESDGNGERGMNWCLPFHLHPDAAVRAASVAAIGKLLTKVPDPGPLPIAAISRALSDPDPVVRENAIEAASLASSKRGIKILPG